METADMIHNSTVAQNKVNVPKLIWSNIFTAVSKLNNAAAWNLLALGTDNDGLVSYLPGYDDASKLAALKLDMISELNKPGYVLPEVGLNATEINRLKFGLTNQQIADKIFFENAFAFLKKYFV